MRESLVAQWERPQNDGGSHRLKTRAVAAPGGEPDLFLDYFPAAIPIPIARTPTNNAIEIPADNMVLISATVVMVFLLPEGLSILTQL